jgi:hypothetical protein
MMRITENIDRRLAEILVGKIGNDCSFVSVIDKRCHLYSDLNKVYIFNPERAVLVEVA